MVISPTDSTGCDGPGGAGFPSRWRSGGNDRGSCGVFGGVMSEGE